MKRLYEFRKSDKHRPLLGAHVVAVVAKMECGIAVRAFNTMGIDRAVLLQAATDELAAYS